MSVYNNLIYSTAADMPAVHCQCLARVIRPASLKRCFRGRVGGLLMPGKREIVPLHAETQAEGLWAIAQSWL